MMTTLTTLQDMDTVSILARLPLLVGVLFPGPLPHPHYLSRFWCQYIHNNVGLL